MSNNSRATEYRQMIEDIIAEHEALIAQGLPGLGEDEIEKMRDIVARAGRTMAANMSEAAE